MADRHTAEQRSRNMAAVRNKHTAPEVHVRQALLTHELRCSTHARLPGRPDLVFNRFKAVVFIHGCFWHMHDCKLGALPTSNAERWQEKLQANAQRDSTNTRKLQEAGWRVKVVWLCELKNKRVMHDDQAQALADWIRSGEQ